MNKNRLATLHAIAYLQQVLENTPFEVYKIDAGRTEGGENYGIQVYLGISEADLRQVMPVLDQVQAQTGIPVRAQVVHSDIDGNILLDGQPMAPEEVISAYVHGEPGVTDADFDHALGSDQLDLGDLDADMSQIVGTPVTVKNPGKQVKITRRQDKPAVDEKAITDALKRQPKEVSVERAVGPGPNLMSKEELRRIASLFENDESQES